jgi:hypothetical protein
MKPILVLMNIGGGITCSSRDKLHFTREPNFCLKGHFYYHRPYLAELLSAIIDNPRVKFGICSSLKRKNADDMIDKIFRGDLRPLKSKIFDVYS